MGVMLVGSLHNAGGTGNASNQAVASGTYTPTFSNQVNASGATLSGASFKWMRVGNTVNVSGKVQVNLTGGTANFEFTLPIASATPDCSGDLTSPTGSYGVVADVSGRGQAYLDTTQVVTGTQVLYISFGYEVV